MKILAINGSPRGRRSNTDFILLPFLQGARNEGAESEVIYLQEKTINHCVGCFSCWTKTPGKCVHNDDMQELLEKIKQADIMVFATPLYYYTVTGFMKDFTDRMLPLAEPHLIKRGETYGHPRRYQSKEGRKIVLISNCGFPERSHFTGLAETFKVMTGGGPDASIFVSCGEVLRHIAKEKHFETFFNALREAGSEVVRIGKIHQKTQAILDRNIIEPDLYAKMANEHWDRIIGENKGQMKVE